MTNITLRVDEDTVRKARKVALEKNTTLAEMIRQYLRSIAAGDEEERRQRLSRLDETFELYSRDMGPRTWTRDDLHRR
ncbi:MAG: DUF6364 family protein [Candidatus Latescibacterota bacterium]